MRTGRASVHPPAAPKLRPGASGGLFLPILSCRDRMGQSMNNEFPRPSFLHPEVGPEKFSEGDYRSGGFMRVAQSNDLPESVRVRARDNFVIKKNKLGPNHPDWRHFFPGDVDFTRNAERRTIPP